MTPLQDNQVPFYARRILGELFAHLKSMDVSLTRMLELEQSPRENLGVQGSQTMVGSVGIAAGSCTIAPPPGYSNGVILPANPHRRGVVIQNLTGGAVGLTLGLGSQSPAAYNGLTLNTSYPVWNGLLGHMLWTGLVSVIAGNGTATFTVTEVLGRNETRRRGGLNQPL